MQSDNDPIIVRFGAGTSAAATICLKWSRFLVRGAIVSKVVPLCLLRWNIDAPKHANGDELARSCRQEDCPSERRRHCVSYRCLTQLVVTKGRVSADQSAARYVGCFQEYKTNRVYMWPTAVTKERPGRRSNKIVPLELVGSTICCTYRV